MIDKFQSISSWGSLINFGLPGLRCETKSLGLGIESWKLFSFELLLVCRRRRVRFTSVIADKVLIGGLWESQDRLFCYRFNTVCFDCV